MRFLAQPVERDDRNALHGLDNVGGNFLAIVEVGEFLTAVLLEKEAGAVDASMRQRERRDLQIAEKKRPVDHAGIGREVAGKMRAIVKRVIVHALEGGHGFLVGIERELALLNRAEATAVIQAHDMVGVGVSDDDRVEPVDLFAKALESEFRCGVDHEFNLVSLDVDRRAHAMIFRIGEELRRVFASDDGHANRSAGAEDGHVKRHKIGGFAGSLGLDMLEDLDKKIASDYGVLFNNMIALRATVLIGDDQVVKHVSCNDTDVGRNMDEYVRIVDAYNYVKEHGDVGPASWKKRGDAVMSPAMNDKKKDYFKNFHK